MSDLGYDPMTGQQLGGDSNGNDTGDWLQNLLKNLGGIGGAMGKIPDMSVQQNSLGMHMPISYGPTGGGPRPNLLTQAALPGSAIPNFAGSIGQAQAGGGVGQGLPGMLGGGANGNPQNGGGGGNPLSLLALLMRGGAI